MLTGTVVPMVPIKHNDPEERLKEYSSSIESYLKNTDVEEIVFVENSGAKIDKTYFQTIANNLGKKFECINALSAADRTNMSVGEARMMEYAINNSALLSKTEYIWKATGRIFIRNIDEIVRCPKNENHFLYSKKYDSVQTWFFGVKKHDLISLLSDAVIDDMASGCIEYAWMNYYRMHKTDIIIKPFPVFPDAIGVNSSGSPYTLSKTRWIMKNIALKMGYFTVR